MNRVLKVVFSRAKGMFVVVSELGRACTKGSLKSVLMAVPMVLASVGAIASDLDELNFISFSDSSANTHTWASNASATSDGAIAIGVKSKAEGSYSTALGTLTNAGGENSVAIGWGAGGGYDQIQGATSPAGDFSVAVGSEAGASGNYSVALGYLSSATADNSVALGYYSVASEANTVSVGSLGAERKIVNVKDGTGLQDVATVGQTVAGLNEILGSGVKVSVDSSTGELSVALVGTEGLGGTGKTTISEAIAVAATSGGVDWSTLASNFEAVAAIQAQAKNAMPNLNNGIAFGSDILNSYKASATGENAVAIGRGTIASGSNSVALGFGSEATNSSAIAVGDLAEANKVRSIAIGYSAVANAWDGISIGYNSNVSGMNSLALGYASNAEAEDSVALGANSKVLASDGKVVSVGSSSLKRRIINVSDGTGLQDAATVNQLTNLTGITLNQDAWQEKLGLEAASNYGIAFGSEITSANKASAYGDNSIALGNEAVAEKRDSVAIGYGAKASSDVFSSYGNSVAIGSYASALEEGSVALGAESKATKPDAVALGSWSKATEANTVSVGDSNDEFYRRIVNVAYGENDHDAATVGQLSEVSRELSSDLDMVTENLEGRIETNKSNIATVQTSLTNKADLDGGNIDVGSWSTKLGVGKVETGNTGLVTGGAVNTALDKVSGDLSKQIEEVDLYFDGSIGVLDGRVRTNTEAIETNATNIANVQTSLTNKANLDGGNIDVGSWSTKLGVGKVEANNTGLVTGGAVKQALAPIDESLSYLDDAVNSLEWYTSESWDKIVENKLQLDEHATKIDGLIVGSNIDLNSWSSKLGVGKVEANNTGLVTGGVVYDALQSIDTIVSSGAKVDASNVGKNAATDNSDKWGEALGTGVVEAGNGKLVTGDVVNTAINTAVSNKLDNDLSSLSDTGKSTISNIAKETAQSAVTVGNGKHTEVTVQTDASGNMTYQVNVKTDGQVTQGNEGIVTGGTVYDAIQSAKNETNANLDKKLDKETFENYQKSNDEKVAVATNTANQALDTATEAKTTADSAKSTADAAMSTADEAKTIAGEANTNAQTALAEAAKHTTVTSSNNSLTVKETTNAQGGKNYDLSVSLGKDQAFETVSAGQGKNQIVMNGNDGTLKVGETVTIHGSTGAITGVAAGEISATSKDAVNGAQLYETQQMIGQNASNIQTLNQQINKTYDKVQRVGAGAAALAALRPQDFSPEHPISGAVGLGHYDGKQAIAVGMYYRPTENFTVGFGASAAGNDDYMMNAGISYRFGGSGSQLRLSQSDINRKVVDLTDQNRALIAQIESSNIREEASANRLNKVTKQLASTQSALKSTQSELKTAQKKAEVADQKLDMVMKELAALREEIQKMKQK